LSPLFRRKAAAERTFAQSWASAERDLYVPPGQQPRTQRQFTKRGHAQTFRAYVPEGARRSLEIGAGRGTISRYLVDDGLDVTLLDIEPGAIDIARENFGAIPATFVVGDVYTSQFEEPFDVILSLGLLEHLADIPGLLAKVYTLLKPGGRFITYNAPLKWSMQRLVNWVYDRPDYHREDLPLDKCLDLMRAAGFSVVDAFHYNPFPIFNTQLLNRRRPITPQTEQFITRAYLLLARLRGKHYMKTNRIVGMGYIVVADKPADRA